MKRRPRWFERKGFTAVEIPYLLADIRQCLNAERCMPLEQRNRVGPAPAECTRLRGFHHPGAQSGGNHA